MKNETQEDTLNLTHAISIKDEDIGKMIKKILNFSRLEPRDSKKETLS
jgi:hypothetical protein